MSRTDKTDPYWVFANKNANFTDHDHERMGTKLYRYRQIRDERGNLVYEEREHYESAQTILTGERIISKGPFDSLHRPQFAPYAGYWMFIKEFSSVPNRLVRKQAYEEALEAVRIGWPDKSIVAWVSRVPKVERYLLATVEDHCTEGEEYSGRGDRTLPCTPGITWGATTWGGQHNSSLRKSEAERVNGTQRSTSRDTLRDMAKAYNAGNYVDDYVEESTMSHDFRETYWW